MKQKLLVWILSVWVLFSNVAPCFAEYKDDPIVKTDKLIQSFLDFEHKSIIDYIPFETIYTIYEKQCSQQSIWAAKKKLIQVLPEWNQDVPVWKYPVVMAKRFITTLQILNTSNFKGTQHFCQNKYLFYNILEATQTAYLKYFNPDYVRWNPTNYSFRNLIKINNNTENLTSEETLLANQAVNYIQSEIWNLLTMDFVDYSDLEELDWKIFIDYNRSCGKTKGSFHLWNKSWKNGLDSINLNISFCEQESFKDNYENYVRQIFIHEIGHYIYVFKDFEKKDFDEICWKSGESSCKKWGFVSEYAQNSAAEDYAESFAYRYLDNFNWVDKTLWSASNSVLWEKMIYFGNLVQHLK